MRRAPLAPISPFERRKSLFEHASPSSSDMPMLMMSDSPNQTNKSPTLLRFASDDSLNENDVPPLCFSASPCKQMQPQQQQQQQQQPQQSDSPGFLTKSYSQPVSSSRSSSMNMSASSSVAVSASAELSAAATLSHILTAYAHCLQPLQPSLPSDAPLLPVVKCRDACHAIASSTLAHLLAFPSDATSYNVVVLDCRYPYEFEGGHIQGAVNVPNPECLEALLLRRDENGQYVGAYDGSRTILVFHCEFSSRRGPRMVQHLRGVDRKANLASYPSLFYPHVFLLEGGYASFVSQHGNLCSPECGYVKMHDERYSDELNRTSTEARRSWGMRRGSSFLGRQSVPS